MEQASRILIRNARLLCPAAGRDELGDCLFQASDQRRIGEILDLGPNLKAAKSDLIIEAEGRALAPGLIDLKVIVGEPGAEHRETFKSAGRAAVAGGVATMALQPQTDPPIDTGAMVDYVLRRGADRSLARVLSVGAATKGLRHDSMAEIGLMMEAGAAFLSAGDCPIGDSRLLSRILTYSQAFGALIAHRPEDPDLARGAVMHAGARALRLGLPGSHPAAERIGLERDLALVEAFGGRLLVDCVSSGASVPRLAAAKASGLAVAASVSIHNLALNEHDVGEYRTFARLSPPLRSEQDRQALVDGLAAGAIDVLVSGHDPQPAESKRLPFEESAPGGASMEFMLPAALRLWHNGEIGLLEILAAMTIRPARLLGLPQGCLTPGAPADLILFDLDRPFVCEASAMRSKSKNTPFDGARFQGVVDFCIVGGHVAFDRQAALGAG